MDDLISRKTAIMAVGDYEKLRVKHGMVTPEKAETVLISLPAADAVEVRHATFIEDGYFGNPCVCSYCGHEAEKWWRFCPNCGADMRGET